MFLYLLKGLESKLLSKNTGIETLFACFYNACKETTVGLRSNLYKAARIMGDINAVKKGKVGRRIGRRAAGKLTGRGLRKLFK